MKVTIDVETIFKCPFREHDMEECNYPDPYCCVCDGDSFPDNCPLVALAKNQDVGTKS